MRQSRSALHEVEVTVRSAQQNGRPVGSGVQVHKVWIARLDFDQCFLSRHRLGFAGHDLKDLRTSIAA